METQKSAMKKRKIFYISNDPTGLCAQTVPFDFFLQVRKPWRKGRRIADNIASLISLKITAEMQHCNHIEVTCDTISGNYDERYYVSTGVHFGISLSLLRFDIHLRPFVIEVEKL